VVFAIAASIAFTVISNFILSRKADMTSSVNPGLDGNNGPSSNGESEDKPTLIIQLRGEMGNHLSSIAHGMGFKWYAEEVFGFEFEVLLRHQTLGTGEKMQDSPKWKPARDSVKKCFPNLQGWNFDRGAQWQEFLDSENRQKEWLPLLTRKYLEYVNGRPWMGVTEKRDEQPAEFQDWNKTLTTLQSLWQRADRPMSKEFSSFFLFRDKGDHAKVSIPFIRSESLENTLVLDNYIDRLKALFAFDFDRCCGEKVPKEDESVFHFRNFATELPNFNYGLEDVSPNQTANVLLQHLQPGDKVAITTRFNNEYLNQQVQALQAKGLQVRVIAGQSGVEDFCFLLRSQKEVVGNYQSSFALWGGMLGDAKAVRFYTIESAKLRSRNGFSDDTILRRFLYKWRHPILSSRIKQVMIPQDTTAP